jgi:hypothetical protein
MKKIMYLLALLLFCSACKQEEKVEFTESPEITAVQLSTRSVRAWQDSIVFTIAYTDGDGDLGENTEGVENLTIKDMNTGIVTTFRIPMLAPKDAKVKIQGEIEVTLRSIGNSGNGNAVNTRFEVIIKDRAGNTSNAFMSEDVTVN